MEHTKEPWHSGCRQIEDGNGVLIASLSGWKGDAESKANARRIVACVNACAELPQDALDGGWTALGMSRHARNVEKQRDELLAVLEGVEKRCAAHGFVGMDGQYLKDVRAAIAKVSP